MAQRNRRTTVPVDDVLSPSSQHDGRAVYGERGVLAYDPLADRIQCHACGSWHQKITSSHLRTHNLTIPEYKEWSGLNDGTALLTPRLIEGHRRMALELDCARNLVPNVHGLYFPRSQGHHRREQYRREHLHSEARARLSVRYRRWTDEDMLAALRALQASNSGYLAQRVLSRSSPPGSPARPSRDVVIQRFGSWKRVCELLGQPFHGGSRKGVPQPAVQQWTKELLLERMREFRDRCGGRMTSKDLARFPNGTPGRRAGRYPSYTTICRYFGSWGAMLAQLDAPVTTPPKRD